MDFKISDTNKGKKSLIYDGFIYRIDGVLKCGDISWRCTNKKCKGRLRTDSAMSTMNAINLEHNHEQGEKKVERQQLRSQVKRKATDDLTSPPSKIIRTELHKFADKLLGSGDVRSIAQSLYRERRKVYPILPKSREDVHAALDYI